MILLEILVEIITSSALTLGNLLIILIPIMIGIEYANRYNLLEKMSVTLGWLPRSLTLSPKASFPLLVGLFIGVFFGAAVFIEYSRKGLLTKRDMLLCGVFLAFNHSIIEDTLIMGAVGANVLILFPLRFVTAYAVTRTAAYYLDRRDIARDTMPAE